MAEILVYAAAPRADAARAWLSRACAATGVSARLEVYGSGGLYQRLGPRRSPPLPDVVFWFGPYAARSAGLDGLLQPYQANVHDPDGKWTPLDYSAVGVVGSGVASLQDLAGAPRLAMADPERSEVGMSILLASLDRFRQATGDVEQGWAWWQRRVATGLVLAEDDPGALALVSSGAASHALTLDASAAPVSELAPLPHAIGLAASSRSVEAARRVLDWLASSPAAPPPLALDIEWAHQQYVAARQRWAASGFGPIGTAA